MSASASRDRLIVPLWPSALRRDRCGGLAARFRDRLAGACRADSATPSSAAQRSGAAVVAQDFSQPAGGRRVELALGRPGRAPPDEIPETSRESDRRSSYARRRATVAALQVFISRAHHCAPWMRAIASRKPLAPPATNSSYVGHVSQPARKFVSSPWIASSSHARPRRDRCRCRRQGLHVPGLADRGAPCSGSRVMTSPTDENHRGHQCQGTVSASLIA